MGNDNGNADELTKQLTTIPHEAALSLFKQAEILIESGMLPGHLDTPSKVVAIMLRGRELGIGPMEALTSINVISGKVSSSTQLMLALIYRSGLLEDIQMVRGDPASTTMKRKGMTPHTATFGQAEAKLMGLLGRDTYRKFPETMYLWRTVAMCARMVFPDVIGAVYTPDELGMEIQSDVETYQADEHESLLERVRALLQAEPDMSLLKLAQTLRIPAPEARRLRDMVNDHP